MIASFGDARTEDLFHGRLTARARTIPPEVNGVVGRKFDMMDAAKQLSDLRSPPGNRLELLRGDFAGYHSVRVNQQWRLVFRWVDGEIHDLRLVDYH